jgi:hypothetical protein
LVDQVASLRTALAAEAAPAWLPDALHALIIACLVRLFGRLEHMILAWHDSKTPTPRHPARQHLTPAPRRAATPHSRDSNTHAPRTRLPRSAIARPQLSRTSRPPAPATATPARPHIVRAHPAHARPRQASAKCAANPPYRR